MNYNHLYRLSIESTKIQFGPVFVIYSRMIFFTSMILRVTCLQFYHAVMLISLVGAISIILQRGNFHPRFSLMCFKRKRIFFLHVHSSVSYIFHFLSFFQLHILSLYLRKRTERLDL